MRFRIASLVVFFLIAPCAMAQALVEKYQAGNHYFLVEPAQPTTSGKKIEVSEVFSYACIHCAHFQSIVDQWKSKMPANVAFTYLPAAWSGPWEMMARAYHASETLGILSKTHMPLFNAIHVERKPFNTLEDIAQWYESFGVKAADFLAVATSSATTIKINRSNQLAARLGVDGTPTIIVNGKYRITGQSAGGYEHVFEIVNFLIEKEASKAR